MCVFFSSFVSACAQSTAIDSLENLLKVAHPDSTRVRILAELSFKYLPYQPPRARQLADEALQLATKTNDIKGESLALNRLGEHEFRQSNYAQAVDYMTRSLKLAEQVHDSLGMAIAYRVLGNINTFGLKRYDVALKYQLSALAIYQKKNDKRNIASFCGNITWIYAITNQNLPEAHRLTDLGVHLADSLHDDQLLSYNYNSKGLISMQEGKPDSAIYFLNKSIALGALVKDNAVIAYDKSLKGLAFLRQNKVNEAVVTFNEAVKESLALNLREVLKDSYGGLAICYEKLQQYPDAYRFHVRYTQLKDSLVNQEITQRALMAELEFKEARREARILELEQANLQERQEKVLYTVGFGGGLLFLVTVLLFVVRTNRNRVRTNRLLEEKNREIAEQNAKLKQTNDVKDKLFSIIGHDLRSPLVSLKGLLGLVVRNEVSDKEFREFAPKLNQHVISVNETLENLLQWSHAQMNGWQTNTTPFQIQPVLEKIATLFAEPAKAKQIALINNVPDHVFVHADKDQVELVFRNLVHNAIKFTSENGSITFSIEHQPPMVGINVMDTGVGINPNALQQLFSEHTPAASRGTKGERGTGLGLRLCREMVSNNGGRIAVTSEEGKGSSFTVFLRQAQH